MGDAYMPQKSFKDHRITLWSWFSPSMFTWELKDQIHVIRLGQQALYWPYKPSYWLQNL